MSPAVATPTVLAPIVTKLVDICRNLFDTRPTKLPKWTWNVLAIAFGVAIAVIWHLNLLPKTFAGSVSQRWAGWVITGIAMGGVGSGWHELFDTLSGIAKRAHAGQQGIGGTSIGA